MKSNIVSVDIRVEHLEQQLKETKEELEDERRWANLYSKESQQNWEELMEAKLRINKLETALVAIFDSCYIQPDMSGRIQAAHGIHPKFTNAMNEASELLKSKGAV